jgi:hypothetical protein
MEKSLLELSPLTVLSPDIWGHLTLFLDWKAIKELLISTEMVRLRLIRGLHKLSIDGKIPPVLRFMSGLLEFETTLNVTNEVACMLPTSLRTLRCPQFETDLDLSKLPRSMDSLDFYLSVSGAINTKGFPSTLTSFTSTNWGGWTAHELSKLPKTLVVLRISSRLTWRPLVDEALEHLPRGLEVLELTLGEILCDVCIPLLPRTLKSLKLQPKMLFLTSIGISKLPPLLTQLYLPSALDGPIKTLRALNGFTGADIELTTRTPWPFPLPSIPSLTELSIPRLRSPIMDSLRQLSPSLTFLDLRSVLDLSFDGHLHSLQHLRTLKLRIISRHDIPYLPSTLTTLVGSNCLQVPNPVHSDYVRNLLAEVNNLPGLIDNVKKHSRGKARTTIHGSTGMTDFMVENKDLLPEHMHAELLPRALKRLHILSLFTLRSLHYLPPHLSEFISGNGEFTFLVTDLIKTLKSAPAPLFKPVHHLDYSRLRMLAEAASSSSPEPYTSSQLDDSSETVAAPPRTPERVSDPWDMPIESVVGLEFLHQPGSETCILLHPFPDLGEFEDWAADRIKTLCISSWNVGMIIPKSVEKLVIVSPPTQPGATTEPTSSIPPGCNFGYTSVTTLIVSDTVAAHGLGATPTALPQSLATLELSISGPWLHPLPPHLTSLRLECSWSTLDLISILLSIPPSLKALKVTYGAAKNKSSYPQATIGVALKMVDQYMQLWNLYSYDDSYPHKVPGQPYLTNIIEEETEVDFATLIGDQVPDTTKKAVESEEEDEEDNYDEDEDEGLEVEDYNEEGERLAVRYVRGERAEKDVKREVKRNRKTILGKLKKLKSQIFEGQTDLALTDEFWTFCTLRLLRDCHDLEDIHFDLQEWDACLAAQVAFLCADPSPSVDETVTGIPKRLARLFRTDWTAEQQASPEALAKVYNSTHTALLPRIMATKPPSDEEQARTYPTWKPRSAANAASSSNVGVQEEKKPNPIHHIPQELVVDDESIKDLAPSMTVLEIPNNTTLSASSLRYLPSSLTVFSLISNQNIDDAAVSILPSGLTNLVLGSTKLTDLCVPSLPRGLTELGVRCNFSDAAIAHLPRSLKVLSMGNNTSMSDVGISLLPPGLEKLNLMANLRLTERSIGALPRSLVHLNLYSNTNMTDDSMSALPEGLVYLNLSGDARLTDLGVSKLPRGLTELILVHNNRITDKGMTFMPRTLTHLRMRANQHITGAGLAELPPGMRSLHLDMAQLTQDDLSRAPHWLLEFSIPSSIVISNQSVFSDLPLLALNTSEAWMRYKRN